MANLATGQKVNLKSGEKLFVENIEAQTCTIIFEKNRQVYLRLHKPDFSLVVGQLVVFYEKNDIVAGGTISN